MVFSVGFDVFFIESTLLAYKLFLLSIIYFDLTFSSFEGAFSNFLLLSSFAFLSSILDEIFFTTFSHS